MINITADLFALVNKQKKRNERDKSFEGKNKSLK